MKKLLFILLIFLTSCASHTDWDYHNQNPYKKKFKYKPKYHDQDYGHRSYGNGGSNHKKKTKVRY